MPIGRVDIRDLMVRDDLVDFEVVNEELISEILILEILWGVFLVEDSADDREEKAPKDEKIFKWL